MNQLAERGESAEPVVSDLSHCDICERLLFADLTTALQTGN
jgi:hypothetical protein